MKLLPLTMHILEGSGNWLAQHSRKEVQPKHLDNWLPSISSDAGKYNCSKNKNKQTKAQGLGPIPSKSNQKNPANR